MEIVQAQCDILCLQELDQIGFYKEELKKVGYTLLRIARNNYSGNRYTFKHDGVGIAWKPNVVKLLSHEHINFDDLEKVYKDKNYRKDNHGQLIMFEHIASGKQFIVGNCHMHWDPKNDCVKHAQALYFLQKASAIAYDLPVILCGDYNSMPNSAAMFLMHNESIFK